MWFRDKLYMMGQWELEQCTAGASAICASTPVGQSMEAQCLSTPESSEFPFALPRAGIRFATASYVVTGPLNMNSQMNLAAIHVMSTSSTGTHNTSLTADLVMYQVRWVLVT